MKMASKTSNAVTTVYQCSECDHCSQNLEEATLHAVQEHGDEDRDEDELPMESDDELLQKRKLNNIKEHLSSDEEYAHMYTSKQSNGNYELQREQEVNGDIWSSDSTKALIECVQERLPELQSKTTKKKAIWEQIKVSLENQISGLTPTKCEQRWKNLLAEQRKYLSGLNKGYGKSKLKKPEYFEEICEILTEEGPECSALFSTSLKEKGKGNSLAYSLQSILQQEHEEESSLNSGSGAVAALGRLTALLEQREATNLKFQKEVLEIEKAKLRYVQRFVEAREKYNAKRLQLLREYMMSQPKAKRKREE